MASTKQRKAKQADHAGSPSSGGSSSSNSPDRQKAGLHSYQKVIVRPGRFSVPCSPLHPQARKDETGRWVRDVEFSEDRLKRAAENNNKLVGQGFKIPAPFAHVDKNKNRPKPLKLGNDGAALDAFTEQPIAWDASLNGGYWRDFQFVEDTSKINPDFGEGPGFVGTVDTFGDPDDLNTPAGKVSRTVQDTSIFIYDKYKPPQAKEPIEDFIAHIAMPVHAIEPGQDNFAEVASMSDGEDGFAVSMADMVDSAASIGGNPAEQDDAQMVEVLGLLKQVQIDLPPDTSRDNLVDVLRIVLRQKIADQRETTPANPLTQAPAGSTNKPAPVAMSDTSTPSVADVLLKRENDRLKKSLHNRLKKLRERGAHELPKGVIDELVADIDAISMSADDIDQETGDFPISYAEKQIALLERTGRPMTGSYLDDESATQMSAPEGSRQEEPPVVGPQEVPTEYIGGILDRVFPETAKA